MLGTAVDPLALLRRWARPPARVAEAAPKAVLASVATLARARTGIVDGVRNATAIARADGLSALFFLLLVTLTFLF